MKVLVISGSPRPRGNTYKVTRMIEERLGRLGDIDVEYRFLKKTQLELCKGCLSCMRRGETTCPNKDGALELQQALAAADGAVFISPVYVHTVTALMKNLFDRFAYICHRPHFLGKPALLVATTELSGAAETLDYMAFPVTTWGYRVADRLGIVYPFFLREGAYRQQVLEQLDRAALRFHQALHSPPRQPRFKELVLFNLLKTKIRLHRKEFPYEYECWQRNGWLQGRYFLEGEAGPGRLKSRLARTLVQVRAGRIMKRLGVDPDALSA